MNPWFQPWMGMYRWPLSGNVTQEISPVSSWLSPQFEFNFAGNHHIETEVVSDVASYGKQIGLMSEALLEIANGEKGDAVAKLESLVEQIEEVKLRHEERLVDRVKIDLNKLKQSDPELLIKLLDDYR